MNLNATTRDSKKHPACTAADLEHRGAELFREFEVERCIVRDAHRGIGSVVILGSHGIRINLGRQDCLLKKLRI